MMYFTLNFRDNEKFLENIHVEKEIQHLSDAADQQLRLLKHKASIVNCIQERN